jgi:hypothetical protein
MTAGSVTASAPIHREIGWSPVGVDARRIPKHGIGHGSVGRIIGHAIAAGAESQPPTRTGEPSDDAANARVASAPTRTGAPSSVCGRPPTASGEADGSADAKIDGAAPNKGR